MSRLRPAAVSGLFYPDSPRELKSMVHRYLDEGDAAEVLTGGSRALIAPHAGYVYSGPVAGSSFRQLLSDGPEVERVVLLGPSHRYYFHGLALPEADAFETPLGKVRIDAELCERILDLPSVQISAPAHAQEHSLEVELPFLQEILGDFGLLPLVVGTASADAVAEVLERVWTDPETLVVISSDLSHFLTYDEAVRVDGDTARRVLELRSDLTGDRACGAIPINGLMLAARRRGLKGKLLDLRNSGDTAGGRDSVVGYGAFELGVTA